MTAKYEKEKGEENLRERKEIREKRNEEKDTEETGRQQREKMKRARKEKKINGWESRKREGQGKKIMRQK